MKKLSPKQKVYYPEKVCEGVSKIANKVLKKKYDWFKGIEIESIVNDPLRYYLDVKGKVFVDEEWMREMWEYFREFAAMSDDIPLGELMKDNEYNDIEELFLTIFTTITGDHQKRVNFLNLIAVPYTS